MDNAASSALERGRTAFRQQHWTDASQYLSSANQSEPLDVDDLERLAIATYLLGHDEDSENAWTRAHSECLRLGDVARATRCAFWLSLALLARGEAARGNGWLARALRIVEESGVDCAERGLLLVLTALGALMRGEADAALSGFRTATEIGDRFADAELQIFGRLGQGQAQALIGRADEASALFDEIMVAVTIGEVSPIAVGVVYCAVIDALHDVFDIRRIQEWTSVLTRWCSAQSGLVLFRGQCLVHRAEVMRLSGALEDALIEAQRACSWLGPRRRPAPPGAASDLSLRAFPIAAAFYQLGEVYRLRGDYQQAEEAYRQANLCGPAPEPGLSLLRLAQGRLKAAEAAIRRALTGAWDRPAHVHKLAAAVEIMLAVGDSAAAVDADNALRALVAEIDAPYARALSAHAHGSVVLASGDAESALPVLRSAWVSWQDIDAPYESARVRLLMGKCHRELDDEDAAQLEFQAAERIFERLGARPDLVEVRKLLQRTDSGSPLTARESQVMTLLAAGRTNREIARTLSISERTVDRHVSNILLKLDLSSRTAATAYAYEHGLV